MFYFQAGLIFLSVLSIPLVAAAIAYFRWSNAEWRFRYLAIPPVLMGVPFLIFLGHSGYRIWSGSLQEELNLELKLATGKDLTEHSRSMVKLFLGEENSLVIEQGSLEQSGAVLPTTGEASFVWFNGRPIGVRVKEPVEDLLNSLGLQNNDIITSINDVPVAKVIGKESVNSRPSKNDKQELYVRLLESLKEELAKSPSCTIKYYRKP